MQETRQLEKYRYNYVNAPKLNHDRPVDVSLELSSLCNMRCTYCYHSDKKNMPFKQRYMSLETFKMIVDEAADAGVSSIKVNWRGESTMNPHYPEMLRYIHSKAKDGVFIDRLTNSNFKFTENRDDIIAALCLQTKVKVSYDSFSKEVFEKQRAGGDHDVTTKNIDDFYFARGRKNILVIQAVRTNANKDEDFEGEISRRWPDAQLSIRDMVEGRVDKNLDEMKHKDRDYSERQSCIQAHARLIFNHNGTAMPCCPDIKEELALGNIKKESLLKIWQNGETLRKDLLSLKAFEKSPCKDCSSFETFKGYKPSNES